MGQVQAEFAVVSGANDLELVAGPRFASPFTLRSVLFQRKMGTAIDVSLRVESSNRFYTIDKVLGMTENYYVFPNARVPHPISLDPLSKVYFTTEGTASASEDQSVLLHWSQE